MQTNSALAVKNPSDYMIGIRSGVSIAIGYVPIALTFGLLAKSSGLSFAETCAMSVFVFAGASQFMALNLIAIGAGGLEMILATFLINIRHLLLSASLNEKANSCPRYLKAIYAFGITDETFSVASTSGRIVTPGYIFGLITMAYSSWVIFSGLGFLIGTALPNELQQSMAIALYAMFIGLLVPSLKKSRKVLFLAGLSALLNCLLTLFMNSGWAIVTATLLSAVLVEVFSKGRDTE